MRKILRKYFDEISHDDAPNLNSKELLAFVCRDIREYLVHASVIMWLGRTSYHGENINDCVFAGAKLYLNRLSEPPVDRWELKEAIQSGIASSQRNFFHFLRPQMRISVKRISVE